MEKHIFLEYYTLNDFETFLEEKGMTEDEVNEFHTSNYMFLDWECYDNNHFAAIRFDQAELMNYDEEDVMYSVLNILKEEFKDSEDKVIFIGLHDYDYTHRCAQNLK